jgi:hypothetical protein
VIAIVVLAVLGAAIAWAAADELGDGALARVLVAVGVMLLAIEPLGSVIAHNRIAARTDTRVLASQWMAEHLAPGTKVQIVGKAIGFYGVLRMPPGIVAAHAKPAPLALAAAGVTHVIVYDHVLPYLRPDPAAMAILEPRLRLVAEFDPFTSDWQAALFEWGDAYYIPFHGFSGVSRPGPGVRIYALDAAGAGPESAPHT